MLRRQPLYPTERSGHKERQNTESVYAGSQELLYHKFGVRSSAEVKKRIVSMHMNKEKPESVRFRSLSGLLYRQIMPLQDPPL